MRWLAWCGTFTSSSGADQNVLFEDLKQRIARGERVDCWMAQLVENNSEGVSEEYAVSRLHRLEVTEMRSCLAWNGGVMLGAHALYCYSR